MFVWYVFYNHTAFKGGTTQKQTDMNIYISCHIVVGVRKASQLVFKYTTDATRYVQTEMMSASITQNCWSHERRMLTSCWYG